MELYKNFPLSRILYYKIGGPAQFVLKVEDREELNEALDFIQKQKITKVLPVGLGSNLLVSEKVFDGAVLWFSQGDQVDLQLTPDGVVQGFSSIHLDTLITFSLRNGLSGLEWAGGLPSTIGASIRGNVGAFGHEVKDVFYKAEVIDLLENNFVSKEFGPSDCEFGYRTSSFKKRRNLIVVSGAFKLAYVDSESIKHARNMYTENIEYRNTNHPLSHPSSGSFFKNIIRTQEVDSILRKWPDIKELVETKWHGKVAMGYVIKRLGLAGFQVGGAQVSEQHANFILNKKGATFRDVITIVEEIKNHFFYTFGFYPEVEVEIIE